MSDLDGTIWLHGKVLFLERVELTQSQQACISHRAYHLEDLTIGDDHWCLDSLLVKRSVCRIVSLSGSNLLLNVADELILSSQHLEVVELGLRLIIERRHIAMALSVTAFRYRDPTPREMWVSFSEWRDWIEHKLRMPAKTIQLQHASFIG